MHEHLSDRRVSQMTSRPATAANLADVIRAADALLNLAEHQETRRKYHPDDTYVTLADALSMLSRLLAPAKRMAKLLDIQPRGPTLEAEWVSHLREHRIKRKLSVQEAADLCGISVESWVRYESGRRAPKPATQEQIIEGLGLK